MNIRVRSLSGVKFAAETVSPDDLALINSEYARVPVAAEEIHVRPARVAHNQHDRTLERFQKAHLERFAETLPGKSLLPGHDTSALPLGRWFRADTQTRTEEFPVFVQGSKAGGGAEEKPEIVPGFTPQKQRVTWLKSAFYFAADPSTEALRKNIDTGVYQDVSIGFGFDDIDCDVCRKSYLRSDCPHFRGQALEDGLKVTLTYSGDPKLFEARETSIVYLGAQQHAELSKALRDGTLDPQALARTSLGEDLVALKEYEALARQFGHARKSWAFPALNVSLPLGEESPLPPPVGEGSKSDDPASPNAKGETPMDLSKEARRVFGLPEGATEPEIVSAMEKARDHGAALQRAEEREATLKTEKAALQPLADTGKKALSDLQEQILADDFKLTGQESSLLKDLLALRVERAEYDLLKAYAAEKRTAVLEKYPAGPSGDPSVTGEKQEEPATPATLRPFQATDYALV